MRSDCVSLLSMTDGCSCRQRRFSRVQSGWLGPLLIAIRVASPAASAPGTCQIPPECAHATVRSAPANQHTTSYLSVLFTASVLLHISLPLQSHISIIHSPLPTPISALPSPRPVSPSYQHPVPPPPDHYVATSSTALTLITIAASPLGSSSPVTIIAGRAFRDISKYPCMKDQN